MSWLLFWVGLLSCFSTPVYGAPNKEHTIDSSAPKAENDQFPLNLNRSILFKDTLKAPTICDDAARQIMGPLVLPSGRKVFFWFFESWESPLERPLIIRLSSLPDQSNFFGLNSGLWPCKISSSILNYSTVVNSYSTNQFANVMYIEQAGVGYSPHKITDDYIEVLLELMLEFHKRFPRYSKLDIHISSESFGAVLATKLAVAMHKEQFQLKSLILGSPIIDLKAQLDAALNLVQVSHPLFEVDKEDIDNIRPGNIVSNCTIDNNSEEACDVAASSFWGFVTNTRVRLFSRIWHILANSDAYTTRRGIVYDSNEFLASSQVQQSIFGTAVPFTDKYLHALSVVPHDNYWLQSCLTSLENLTKADVGLLLYSGELDLLSHPSGLHKIVQQLSTKIGSRRPCLVRIPDAGHLASFDNPQVVQKVIKNWLKRHTYNWQ